MPEIPGSGSGDRLPEHAFEVPDLPLKLTKTPRILCGLRLPSLHPNEPEFIGAVTGNEMGGRGFSPARRLRPAYVDRVRTTGVEVAATGRRGRVRHFSFKHDVP